MQTAAGGARAAAEVIGGCATNLRQHGARQQPAEERSRVMETLGALLDAIDRAYDQQRSAIDALVASSADLLERVGGQFAAKVDSEAGKLIDIGASVSGSALGVASLGRGLRQCRAAVQRIQRRGSMAALQQIEGALAKSLTRSDGSLPTTLAQAREIIDLSIMRRRRW